MRPQGQPRCSGEPEELVVHVRGKVELERFALALLLVRYRDQSHAYIGFALKSQGETNVFDGGITRVLRYVKTWLCDTRTRLDPFPRAAAMVRTRITAAAGDCIQLFVGKREALLCGNFFHLFKRACCFKPVHLFST